MASVANIATIVLQVWAGVALTLLLAYYVVLPLVLSAVLRLFSVRRKVNRRGESLLEVAPRWRIRNTFFVYICRSEKEPSLEAYARLYGNRAPHILPRQPSGPTLKISVYNLVLDFGRRKKDTSNDIAGNGKDSSPPAAEAAGTERRADKQRSIAHRLLHALVSKVVSYTLLHLSLLARHVNVHFYNLQLRAGDRDDIKVDVDDIGWVGDRRSLLHCRFHCHATSAKAELSRGDGSLLYARVESGANLSVDLDLRKELWQTQYSYLQNVHVRALIPKCSLWTPSVLRCELHGSSLRAGIAQPLSPADGKPPLHRRSGHVFHDGESLASRFAAVSDGLAASACTLKVEHVTAQLQTSSDTVLDCSVLKLAVALRQSKLDSQKRVRTVHAAARGLQVNARPGSGDFSNALDAVNTSTEPLCSDEHYHLLTTTEDDDQRGDSRSRVKDEGVYRGLIAHRPQLLLRADDIGVLHHHAPDKSETTVELGRMLIVTSPSAPLFKSIVARLPAAAPPKNGGTSSASASAPASASPKHSQASDVRFVLRNSTALVLTEEPTGDAKTVAFALSFSRAQGLQCSCAEAWRAPAEVSLHGVRNLHFMQYGCLKNVHSRSLRLVRAPPERESRVEVHVKDSFVRWDTDWQDFFDQVKFIVSPFTDIGRALQKRRRPASTAHNGRDDAEEGETSTTRRPFHFRQDCRFLVEGLYLEVRFSDGPCAAMHMGAAEEWCIDDELLRGRELYWIVDDRHVVYAEVWEMSNFYITHKQHPKVSRVNLMHARVLLPHNFHYGASYADWWLRLRTYLNVRRRRRRPNAVVKKQFADLLIRGYDVEGYIVEDPLNVFLLRYLPLWRDETVQRNRRHARFEERQGELPQKKHAEAYQELLCIDSESYVKRVRAMKEATTTHKVRHAPEFPEIDDIVLAQLTIADVEFNIVADEAVLKLGTPEHMRRLKEMDTCTAPDQEVKRLDAESWMMLGFRMVHSSLKGVRLQLKNYPTAVVTADNLDVHGGFGLGRQKVGMPYVTKTQMGLGTSTLADVHMSVTGQKMFCNATLSSEKMQIAWNHAYLPAWTDFQRSWGRFGGETRDLSARMMAWDVMRLNFHTKLRVQVKELVVRLAVGLTPHARIDHYVDITASSLDMLLTRQENEYWPLTLTASQLSMQPRVFLPDCRSDIGFDNVIFKMSMAFERSDPSLDPTDHYLQPFPEPQKEVMIEEDIHNVDNAVVPLPLSKRPGPDEYTVWSTTLQASEGWDTYRSWRSRSCKVEMLLDFSNRPLNRSVARRERYRAAQYLYSDGLSTLLKVFRLIGSRLPATRPAPPFMNPRLLRHPPPTVTLGSIMRVNSIKAYIQGVRLVLWNNLRRGHGLHVSMEELVFEQLKKRDEGAAAMALSRRSVVLHKIKVRVLIPEMDIGGIGDNGEDGFLLTADVAQMHTDPAAADVLRSEDVQQIRTKSVTSLRAITGKNATGKNITLDEAVSKNKVSMNRVRLFISPDRRDAIVYWQRALREKKFPLMKHSSSKSARPERISAHEYCRRREVEILRELGVPEVQLPHSPSMKSFDGTATGQDVDAERSGEVESNSSPEEYAITDTAGAVTREEEEAAMEAAKEATRGGKMVGASRPSVSFAEDGAAKPESTSTEPTPPTEPVSTMWPLFHMIVEDTQVMFGSVESDGLLVLTSREMEVHYSGGATVHRHQSSTGETTEAREEEREWLVCAKDTQLFSVDESRIKFGLGDRWVHENAGGGRRRPTGGTPSSDVFEPLVSKPVVLNLLYVTAQGKSSDTIAPRPAILSIDVPEFCLDTTSQQFQIFRQTIDLLNKRLPFATQTQHELSVLQFNRLRSPDKIDPADMMYYARMLQTILAQYEYSMDTGEEELVRSLHPDSDNLSELQEYYVARELAFNTFVNREHTRQLSSTLSSASSQYATMFFSCKFDKIEWDMRDTSSHDTIANMNVQKPVFHRVVYMGSGSSFELTFTDVSVVNRMRGPSLAQKALALHCEPSMPIRSSDQRLVAFKWFHVVSDNIGGINVYENLVLKVAPMRTFLTTRLLRALHAFALPSSKPKSAMSKDSVSVRRRSKNSRIRSRGAKAAAAKDEIETMRARARDSTFFQYVYVGEVKLEVSVRFKDEEKQSKLAEFLTAVYNLTVTEEPIMYSGRLWTWDDLLTELKGLLNRMRNKAITSVLRSKLKLGLGRKNEESPFATGRRRHRLMDRGWHSRPHGNEDEDGSDDDEVEDDEEADDDLEIVVDFSLHEPHSAPSASGPVHSPIAAPNVRTSDAAFKQMMFGVTVGSSRATQSGQESNDSGSPSFASSPS